jgi:hypothetical protein
MSSFEVDFSFEDFNLVTVVEAVDEYEAEVIARDKLAVTGIDVNSFLLYETTIEEVN